MLISVLFAWVAAFCLLLTTVKFLVKRNKKLNKFFHRIHLPCGIIMIAAGLCHGLVAGNSPRSSLGDAMVAPLLFSLNMGTICFVLSVLLGITYLLRKKLKKLWMLLHRVLTVLLLLALVIHLIQTGISLPSFFMFQVNETTASQVVSTTASPIRQGGITAEPSPVPAADDAEASKEAAPAAVIESAIELSNESTETSDEATSFETKDTYLNPQQTEQPQQIPTVTFSGAVLKDGTYEGSAYGFRGTIKLYVLVSNGAVTTINVLQQNDTPQYWQRASTLINTIVEKQSLEVDAISGATFSSKGILNAVYQALKDAVTEGTMNITEITTNNNSHGGPGRH